jgi:hypothetical protein
VLVAGDPRTQLDHRAIAGEAQRHLLADLEEDRAAHLDAAAIDRHHVEHVVGAVARHHRHAQPARRGRGRDVRGRVHHGADAVITSRATTSSEP